MARVVRRAPDAEPIEAAFFFGTLMVPKILRRVIGHDGHHLVVRDAVLPEYTRHHVRDADYPAIVPAREGRKVMGRDLSADEASVRGTLVTGLSPADLEFLDEFEGDEYGRDVVRVQSLGGEASDAPQVPCWAYVWASALDRLDAKLWSYDDFCRDSLVNWVRGDEEYVEVDRRRALNGRTTPDERIAFGHALRNRYWRFEPGWRNLNHGSYGSAPAPTVEAFRRYQDMAEAAPDRFMRQTQSELLTTSRREVATLLGCDLADLMLVPNTTSGVHSVFASLPWRDGDVIVHLSTIYGACRNILRSIADGRPEVNVSLLEVDVTYPIADDELLERVEAAITASRQRGQTIRIALFDAITSIPAVLVPWEKLCEMMRRYGILSFVDGAHAIGILDVDLRRSDPDFFVTNLHKHLFVHRGCAALVVPKRNQPLVHSLPIGFTYHPIPRDGHVEPAASVTDEWAWTATQDWSGICAIPDVLAFRRTIGGEASIRRHNRELALTGGRHVARMLGTEVLENEAGTLTTSMVNIRLPIALPADASELTTILATFKNRMIDEFRTYMYIFPHNGSLWARLTAQVYLELDDFDFAGTALKHMCDDVR